MSKSLIAQLKQVKGHRFDVDGVPSDIVPDDFNKIVFYKSDSKSADEVRVVFEDYIIKPFVGFDFHDKFNNGVPPYSKVMYGKITKETEKMYQFSLHSETSTSIWNGWCPKKSCSVVRI